MKIKNTLIVLITVIALGVFSFTFVNAVYYAPSPQITMSNTVAQKYNINTAASVPASRAPLSLVIPKINVNAHIDQVGITLKGNMATAANFSDVGWYKYGTVPGDTGSAVIAGHLDDGLGLPAIFYHLSDLKVGDSVYVVTADNQSLHFVVTKMDTYDFNASVSQVFTENDDKLLKLITCAGDWLPDYKTHNKRLVVTAVLADDSSS